jgi:hypothetical protein
MKKFFIILLMALSFSVSAQVLDDKVILNVGEKIMEAPLPTTIEEYKSMLSTVVTMYNNLNFEYNELEGNYNEAIAESLVFAQEIESYSEKYSQLEQNIRSDAENLTNLGRLQEQNRMKFGFGLNYSLFKFSLHHFYLDLLLSKNRLFFTVGPALMIELDNLNSPNTYLGAKLGIGYWF